MDTQPVSLLNLNGSVITEKFNAAMRKVLDNIADPTVKADAVRKIKIEIRIKPDEDRSNAQTEIDCDPVLPKPRPSKSFIYLSLDEDGVKATVSTAHQLSLRDELENRKQGGSNAG